MSIFRPGTLAPALALALAAAVLPSCSLRLPVSGHPEPPARVVNLSKQAKAGTREQPSKDPDVMVWMIADKYHTGLVFPYEWLLESGYVAPKDFGNPMYVTMSWGNRDAYSKAGIDSSWKMFRVLFTPTPSVMELIAFDWNVVDVCPHQRIWRKLVSRDSGPAVAAFLNGCAVRGPDGRPKVVCEASWGRGVQLEGSQSYFIPRVCNVWTAQAIECMGGDLNPWFGLTADGLARQIEAPPNRFEKIWDAYPKERR